MLIGWRKTRGTYRSLVLLCGHEVSWPLRGDVPCDVFCGECEDEMAQFCEECNKPIANTPESKRLAVYCQCVPLIKAKRIAEREMVRNTVDSRPPITHKEEKTEIEVRENAAIDALGIIAATEEEDKRCAINYELVLDDMMTRYTEMGIAIIAIRRILKEQGKDPDA